MIKQLVDAEVAAPSRNATLKIKDQIWKMLRAFDVQPAILPKLHQELCEVYLQGFEIILQHTCRCKMNNLLMHGCRCGGK